MILQDGSYKGIGQALRRGKHLRLSAAYPQKAAAFGARPHAAIAIPQKTEDAVNPHGLRQTGAIRTNMQAVKADQAAGRADPEQSVRSPQDGLHRVFRQTIGGSPEGPRVWVRIRRRNDGPRY